MKKSTPRRLPRKLVLRKEPIAVLTPPQLGNVPGGGSQLRACTVWSNDEGVCGTTEA
ncbi:MAG TPA: class I lanthipeptide [Kofleriaceae bacterium]